MTIDGIKLGPVMVRYLMAQNSMPHIADRVQSVDCATWGAPVFDRGALAFTPMAIRKCHRCGSAVRPGTRLKKCDRQSAGRDSEAIGILGSPLAAGNSAA